MAAPTNITNQTANDKAALGRKMLRRTFLMGISTLTISGCVSSRPVPVLDIAPAKPVTPPMYYAMPQEQFPLPEVDMTRFDPNFWRSEVDYVTDERPGSLIVDTPNKYLYHVLPGGRATRYGIGVGRDGFSWAGRAVVAYKRKWPRWTPPNEMVARQPELEPYSIANGGQAPGLTNPLGARALYIHKDGKDTIYRIHGSQEAWTMGRAVSSGCIRLINQDIIHLYDNVRDGSPLIVLADPSQSHLLVG